MKRFEISEQESVEIQDRFRYHPPSEDGKVRHGLLTDIFYGAAMQALQIVPPGRERSLMLTKLEEAKFWASAGVARNMDTR